jgi:hypothetical protein
MYGFLTGIAWYTYINPMISRDFMKPALALLFLACSLAFPQFRGNGDCVDSFPNFLERQLLVLTNACRMAPVEYRDLYIGNYQVLLPANYPPVKPLYWNRALNRSARAHAIDMANNCGLQHNSCNGTVWSTRVKSYYTKSQTIAENIAAGNATALATVKQWVLEGDPVPADRSSGDGHRKNIMDSLYRELGMGYARGPKQYTYFWVQDFGGGAPDFNNPLVAGAHFFIENSKTTFLVNYSDPVSAPSSINCVIENQPFPMTRALGTETRATWSFVQTKGTACRNYYFTCIRSGVNFRYPEYGMLATSGEGNCAIDYIPPESLSVVAIPPAKARQTMTCVWHGASGIRLYNLPERWKSAIITILDLKGRVVALFMLRSAPQSAPAVDLPFRSAITPTVYFVHAVFDEKELWTGKIAIRPQSFRFQLPD